MNSSESHPWLHRMAVMTVFVAMITLIAGALVTTKNAGMAFPDWPTSDGQNMLTYPWLADFARNGDKFLEHGHRLAGMLIGIWSILLVVAFWCATRLAAWRWLSVAVLGGVICQGILGGFRVQLDERGLAMLHGLFAAIVFSIIGCLVVVTSRRWQESPARDSQASAGGLTPLSIAIVALVLLQYVLGGLIRHKGSGLHEHLGLGLLLPMLAAVNTVMAIRSKVKWLGRSAFVLLAVVLGQVGLGLMTWVLKFGFTPTGYVATAGSIQQVGIRTVHTVFGIIVLMTAVTYALKVLRVGRSSHREVELALAAPPTLPQLGSGGAQ